MQFRLINTLVIFQKRINSVLGEHLNKFIIAYLNNIIVYLISKEKHKEYIYLFINLTPIQLCGHTVLLFYIMGKPNTGQKTPSSACYTLSAIYFAAYKYQKGVYRRLLLLFGKPLTQLAYLLPFLSLPPLTGAPPHSGTAVGPAVIGTILRAVSLPWPYQLVF